MIASFPLIPTRFLILLALLLIHASAPAATRAEELKDIVSRLSSYQDRTSGSKGSHMAADYIHDYFAALGLKPQNYLFSIPVRKVTGASILFDNTSAELTPLFNNAATPQTTNGVLRGPLYYVGRGTLADFDRKLLQDSILLMDFDSGRNWQTAAALGAQAVIFIDSNITEANSFFREKEELSPLQFPCFWMEAKQALELFGPYRTLVNSIVREQVEVKSTIRWQDMVEKNIYSLIEGKDPDLKQELLVIEAFYDSTGYVAGRSPGADESVSIASLLKLADYFSRVVPARSILLVATSGHAQSLHGMRDLVWSLKEKSGPLKELKEELKDNISDSKKKLELINELKLPLEEDNERDRLLVNAISNNLKFEIDRISRKLMNLRLNRDGQKANRQEINALASQRFTLRRLSWRTALNDLPEEERLLLKELLPLTRQSLEQEISDFSTRLQALKTAMAFRSLVKDHTIGAVLSLHLSSHGEGIGGFHQGWLYRLRPRINRTGVFSTIADIFLKAAEKPTGEAYYINTLQPERLRTWDSYFPDKPFLGGEVASLAGYIGVSLVTVGDGRSLWGTPWDTAEKINWDYLENQLQLLTNMVSAAADAPALHNNLFPRNGFSSVAGKSNLLLQGELFADYPAEGTLLVSYQGIAKLYSTVNKDGTFIYKGVADKKNVQDKLIIEGYRFDDSTGEVIWAIDKKETGKDNYRVKMQRRTMKTRLVMFPCRETTVFDLLEPRNLNYMTKLYLFDGRQDAPPQRYWYSRVDTKQSILSSIYLEPGARLKLTLSDNVITRKFILSNGNEDKPFGTGYPVDEHPAIPNTVYRAAIDAWSLLTPRIINLERHGIYDERINSLKERGLFTLAASTCFLNELDYSQFREAASESLALAARVYSQIEKTQKDILFGVLFYIALFVPFAFCMERFLFGYSNIYKRISAFLIILVALILIIYTVHPAFELAYSPMVIILAFFIIGLSLMVTLIIYFRFEEEMILMQRHASHMSAAEISRWKAFVAAFFLGVSNLKRRRLRTILTCSTLIILTFTIMSFTTVKSSRQENRLLFNPDAPYHGLLLKKLNWRSLPAQAIEILENSMQSISRPAPRVWLEAADPAKNVYVPLKKGDNRSTLNGLVGFSHIEPSITGLDKILSSGRWFREKEYQAIILPEQAARALNVNTSGKDTVDLWGKPFTVIGTFAGPAMDKLVDLDGEPLTPVTFPEESITEMSEAEYEAMESGEDIQSFQSRYTHVPAATTAIIYSDTLLSMGGKLKNVALRTGDHSKIDEVASRLVDRFSLSIFAGTEDGVWLFNISDTMSYGGVPNIVVPLLISVLIVLNTMISSVYERKNEIGVYTSVGLAPSHVAFLFVAEAMALAVISVVLGYLLAQVSAALLSATPFWEGITVNYSSMAGVAAMVLVICVVLISVIYPSRVASRIAIPDVKRSFGLPEPVNDTISVTLPFLMKVDEYASIGGFLHAFFSSHQDISHGTFSSGPIEIVHACASVKEIQSMAQDKAAAADCVHLRAQTWLAPFDFGVMQKVDIRFLRSRENKSFLEIELSAKRESGESGQWQRLTKLFVHELRKQLLVWRSMEQETHRNLARDFQALIEHKRN